MELTLVGLQYSGKTTFVNVIAVRKLVLGAYKHEVVITEFCLFVYIHVKTMLNVSDAVVNFNRIIWASVIFRVTYIMPF
jgi:hypothetical protein